MADPGYLAPALAIRTLIALVFLTGALGKMRHLTVFQGVVANYRLLPDVLILPFAYLLPPLEAMIAVALLVGSLSPWAEMAAALLLMLFAVAMSVNLRRGRRHIDCGCFQSALKQSLSWKLVIRNAIMVLLLSVSALPQAGSADLSMKAQGLLAGVVSFIILQSLNILWGIVPAWREQQRFASRGTP